MTARMFQAASFIAAAPCVRDCSGILCERERERERELGTGAGSGNGTESGERDGDGASKDTAESPTA